MPFPFLKSWPFLVANMTTVSSSVEVPMPLPVERAGPIETDAELRARRTTSRVPLDKVETGFVTNDPNDNPLEVIGSTNIYDEEGKIRLIPVSSLPSCRCCLVVCADKVI